MTKSTRSHAHVRLGSQAFDAKRILMIVSHRPAETVEYVKTLLLVIHVDVLLVLLVY